MFFIINILLTIVAILFYIIVLGSLLLVIIWDLSFKLFGKKAVGYVVGYTYRQKGKYGTSIYNYRIEYYLNGETILATSTQGIMVPHNSYPTKKLHSNLNIRYKKKKPEVVYVEGDNMILIFSILMLILIISYIYFNMIGIGA